MRALLAHRDVRISLAGQVLSTLGDNALWIALGIWIKMLTGSSPAAGLSFFMFTAGSLVSPAGGLVVDRCRRRPALVALNLLAAVLLTPLLLVRGRGDIWLIYTVMFGYGVMAGVIGGAQTALTQAIVPRELLGEVNALSQTLLQGLRLVSPLIGAGLLTAVGARPLVLGDAATFVLCAGLMCLLAVREDRPERTTERMWSQLTGGVRHIAGVPVLRRLVAATALAIVGFGFSETVVFAVAGQGLHRAPSFVGVLDSAQGVGAIVAGVLASRLMRRLGEAAMVTLGLVVCGAGFALNAVPLTAVVLLGVALVGAGTPLIVVALLTVMQRRTPARLMGRVDTAVGVMISAPQTAAIGVGAALLSVVGFRALLAAMTVTLLAAAVYVRVGARDEVVDGAGVGDAVVGGAVVGGAGVGGAVVGGAVADGAGADGVVAGAVGPGGGIL
ncbi:MFS transporter [Streptomyces sp. SL13]|uniref:MFS transporter n=1 Tax=Streptantibioticus silvisoli TaxID=2705255 RepID=A0AA90KFR2_9ACTN|nr:MFS transporter [Streptantibioticus silvisoli]MDI5969224.1 MFS transporter [Streptantibioticus silvisoli]